MTTVGFGDVVPLTEAGIILTSLLMIISNLYMAMPIGLIGHSFTRIWQRRHEIMLVKSTRDRLDKWGFGPHEIPGLFELFDLDGSSEMDLDEFKLMLAGMQIGFTEDDSIELFKLIDSDAGGTID